jgi:hypothetical protein
MRKSDPNDVNWAGEVRDNNKGGRHKKPYRGLQTSAAFLAALKPPNYVIKGILIHGTVCTLTGNTGHGKTLIALLMAIKVALGDWFCGRQCRQGRVVFLAGENPENVRVQFYSLCRELGIDGAVLPIVWHDGVFSLEDAYDRVVADLVACPDIVLVIADSQQAFFEGDDDNSNMQMLDSAIAFRKLIEPHPKRPACIALAHPVKNASRENIVPRGGSALLNELDWNLTAWLEAEKNIITLHHTKHRGAPFEPIDFETVQIQPEGLVDEDGDQVSCTIIRPLGDLRQSELEEQAASREKSILEAMRDDPRSSQNMLAVRLGIPRITVQRTISKLKERKLVRQMFGKWVLSKAAKEALETT